MTACSPASLMDFSTSCCAFSTSFSMRAGWMRPSCTSRPSAMRATSRRIGSKLEMITASGVSSTTRSTPVACSMARMLRPWRPMMRPFISSAGNGTLETVVSDTCSEATRSITQEMISRARRVGLRHGLGLHFPNLARHVLAGVCSTAASSSCLASSWLMLAMRSELGAVLLFELGQVGFPLVQLALALVKLPVAGFQLLHLAIQRFLAALDALFGALHFASPRWISCSASSRIWTFCSWAASSTVLALLSASAICASTRLGRFGPALRPRCGPEAGGTSSAGSR